MVRSALRSKGYDLFSRFNHSGLLEFGSFVSPTLGSCSTFTPPTSIRFFGSSRNSFSGASHQSWSYSFNSKRLTSPNSISVGLTGSNVRNSLVPSLEVCRIWQSLVHKFSSCEKSWSIFPHLRDNPSRPLQKVLASFKR